MADAPATRLDRIPGGLFNRGSNSGRIDYDSFELAMRQQLAQDSRVERDDDTTLLISDGTSQITTQYEFSLSAGVARVAGTVDRFAALVDQPVLGTDAWGKSMGLDGAAPALLTADGQTYDTALCVVLLDDGAGNKSLDLAMVFGDEAADGAEVAVTAQQIRDALGATALPAFDDIDPDCFLVINRVKIQRVAVDTISTTITDPASDDPLLNERSSGYSLDAS